MRKKDAIADTGFVVAILNQYDEGHADSLQIYARCKSDCIFLPQTILVEIAQLILRDMRPPAATRIITRFLRELPNSKFRLFEVTEEDLLRTASILEKYADSRIDFADATVMSVAERLKIRTVFTFDRRDFQIFRPEHCDSFEILP